MSFYGSQSAEPGAGKRLPLVVEAALGIIRREYAFLDGIGELAERLEVSQEYLTRCFCRFIGPGSISTGCALKTPACFCGRAGTAFSLFRKPAVLPMQITLPGFSAQLSV